MVGTIDERLTRIKKQLARLDDQTAQLAQNQTALLESGIHVIERLPALHADIEQAESRLAALVQNHCVAKRDLDRLDEQLIQAATKSDLERFAAALDSLASANLRAHETILTIVGSLLTTVEKGHTDIRAFLQDEAVRQVCVETSDYASTNPEVGLMSFLYSHLPGRTALDIGAHVGSVSERLLNTGYEVFAFEPWSVNYTQLIQRLSGYDGFHGLNVALGAIDGELPLALAKDTTSDRVYDDASVFPSLYEHGMPEGLSFYETVRVPVKKLATLHREGAVPADVSLVKIDTEGYDLEVIRGMEDHRYPVVVVEFWDADIPFADKGLLYTTESMAREMRQRDYFWYIVLYRVWGENRIGYFCNHDRAVPRSWGNMFFFRNRETFQHAQQWCSAVLPRTYFKHRAHGSNVTTDPETAAVS
jgi:FkbM family methyltransferase